MTLGTLCTKYPLDGKMKQEKLRNPSSHMQLLFSLSIHVTEEESSGPSLH